MLQQIGNPKIINWDQAYAAKATYPSMTNANGETTHSNNTGEIEESVDHELRKKNINVEYNITKHELTNKIDRDTDPIFYIQKFFKSCPRHEDYLKSFKKKIMNRQYEDEFEFKKEKNSYSSYLHDNIFSAVMSSKKIEKEKYNCNDNDKPFVNIRDYELYQYKYGSRRLNIIRVKDIEDKLNVDLSSEEKEILHTIIENEVFYNLFIRELEKQTFQNTTEHYTDNDMENDQNHENNNLPSNYEDIYIKPESDTITENYEYNLTENDMNYDNDGTTREIEDNAKDNAKDNAEDNAENNAEDIVKNENHDNETYKTVEDNDTYKNVGEDSKIIVKINNNNDETYKKVEDDVNDISKNNYHDDDDEKYSKEKEDNVNDIAKNNNDDDETYQKVEDNVEEINHDNNHDNDNEKSKKAEENNVDDMAKNNICTKIDVRVPGYTPFPPSPNNANGMVKNNLYENIDTRIPGNTPFTPSVNNEFKLNYRMNTANDDDENLDKNNEKNEKLNNGEDPDGILDWCANLDQYNIDNIELI